MMLSLRQPLLFFPGYILVFLLCFFIVRSFTSNEKGDTMMFLLCFFIVRSSTSNEKGDTMKVLQSKVSLKSLDLQKLMEKKINFDL